MKIEDVCVGDLLLFQRLGRDDIIFVTEAPNTNLYHPEFSGYITECNSSRFSDKFSINNHNKLRWRKLS